jgi:hypothetical protein
MSFLMFLRSRRKAVRWRRQSSGHKGFVVRRNVSRRNGPRTSLFQAISRCRRAFPAQRGVAERSPPVQNPPADTPAGDEAGLSKNGEVIGDVAWRTTKDVRERSGRGWLLEQLEDLGTGRTEQS